MAPPKKSNTTKAQNKSSKSTRTSTTEPPPNWPEFKPLRPTSDLSLTQLVDSQIVLIRDFWTSTLCKNYVNFLKTLPLITTPGTPKKGDAVRVNDRFRVDDAAFANRLWVETGLRELICGSDDDADDNEGMSKEERERLWYVDPENINPEFRENLIVDNNSRRTGGEVVGLNPSIRIYRYKKGQFFDQHYDESNIINLPTSPKATPAKTTWTLLLYLTSPATGCVGGETVFYPDDIPFKKSPIDKEVVVGLETGMLLLHKHGNECMLHEGREVTEGEKWIIRSDLCVRR